MEACIAAHASAPTGDAELDAAAGHFWGFANAGGDTARAVAEAVRAREYFAHLQPSGGHAQAVACLKAVWLTMAPPVLHCADAGRAALDALPEAPAQRTARIPLRRGGTGMTDRIGRCTYGFFRPDRPPARIL